MSHHWGYGGNNGECGGRALRAARSRPPLRHLPSTAAPVAQPGCLGPSRVPVLGCPWRHSERCRGSDLKPSRPRTGAGRDSPTQNRKQYLWGPQLVTVCKPRQNRTKIVTNILVVGHRKIKGRGRGEVALVPFASLSAAPVAKIPSVLCHGIFWSQFKSNRAGSRVFHSFLNFQCPR